MLTSECAIGTVYQDEYKTALVDRANSV